MEIILEQPSIQSEILSASTMQNNQFSDYFLMILPLDPEGFGLPTPQEML